MTDQRQRKARRREDQGAESAKQYADGVMHALSPALIVEGDPTMQRRLASIIREVDSEAEITIIGTLAEANALLEDAGFAIALVDIELPDGGGCELISRLHSCRARMPVLVVSSLENEAAVLSVLRAGATGYMLKEREDIELVMSLKSIQRGGAPIDPHIARRLFPLLTVPSGPPDAPSSEEVRLSARELEVLQLMARGCSNQEIADLISLSRLTVEGHIKATYRKLSVCCRTAAVFEAQKLGLLR